MAVCWSGSCVYDIKACLHAITECTTACGKLLLWSPGAVLYQCTAVHVQLHVMCEMHGLAYTFWLSRTVVELLQELRYTTTSRVVLAAAASAMSVLPPSRPVC